MSIRCITCHLHLLQIRDTGAKNHDSVHLIILLFLSYFLYIHHKGLKLNGLPRLKNVKIKKIFKITKYNTSILKIPSLIFLKMMESGRNNEKASKVFLLGNKAVEFSYAFIMVNNKILTALHSIVTFRSLCFSLNAMYHGFQMNTNSFSKIYIAHTLLRNSVLHECCVSIFIF